MNDAISRHARIIKWASILGNRWIAKVFVDNDGPLHLVRPHSTTVVFGESNLEITPDNIQLLASTWKLLDSLARNHNVLWSNHGDAALRACVGDLTYIVSTSEEAIIINEVFGEGIYALIGKGPVHLVDIGANVGITSLFFASQPWVEQVTGFEPVKPTYEKALEHLGMNPNVAGKVTLYNFGLAGSDKDLSIEYSPTWKGSVGIGATPQFVKDAPDLRVELIHLRRASSVLEQVLAASPNERTIIKMDCEGAEYEIMEDLVASGGIHRAVAFMIEWHDLGSARIVAALLESGFLVWSNATKGPRDLGIIYAINNSLVKDADRCRTFVCA